MATTELTGKETWFVRHGKTWMDLPIRNFLREENLIAIHYGEGGLNPENYPYGSARDAMRRFCALAMAGGYVCSQNYVGPSDSIKMLFQIGKVRPISEVRLIFKDGLNRNDAERKSHELKTLQLENVVEVDPIDYPSLHAAMPQQSTFCRWLGLDKLNLIPALVEKHPLKPAVGLLAPPTQELLCSEALRLGLAGGVPLMFLLATEGGTRADVDIDGLDRDGEKILAQVTYRDVTKDRNAQAKLEVLKSHAGNAKSLFFFCAGEQAPREHDGVLIVGLDWLLQRFFQHEYGFKWFKAALGPEFGRLCEEPKRDHIHV